jgi:hypothetical protein
MNNVDRPEVTMDSGDEASSGPSSDARERAERLIRLLDEWMADESGHDEEMWPKLKAVLEQDRISSRPLFNEDPR